MYNNRTNDRIHKTSSRAPEKGIKPFYYIKTSSFNIIVSANFQLFTLHKNNHENFI